MLRQMTTGKNVTMGVILTDRFPPIFFLSPQFLIRFHPLLSIEFFCGYRSRCELDTGDDLFYLGLMLFQSVSAGGPTGDL